jgi:NADPH:quinone reductase-like Zn-dependent oxidoreductase
MKEMLRWQIEETVEEAVSKLWRLLEKGGVRSVVSIAIHVTLAPGEEAEREAEAERVGELLGYAGAGGHRPLGRRLYGRGSLVVEID